MTAHFTDALDFPLVRRGKVRDTYLVGDDLLIVASDRISAFDVILPTMIEGKGQVLTALSTYWLERTQHLIPNHLITADLRCFPTSLRTQADALAGRSMLVQRADRIDVECVVRGFLAGSGWREYEATGCLAEEPLPTGIGRGDPLPTPRFTPAWKLDDGHDQAISRRTLAERIGDPLAARLETVSLELYRFGAQVAAAAGLILVDTKFEFGWVEGNLTLIDEVLTPDSSRFWDGATSHHSGEPASFDKQFVRDWLETTGWNKVPPGPVLPTAIVEGTISRYREVAQRLLATGAVQ